jgi:hypothetical protein
MPVCPNTGLSRPNFFAGQLLTEDDLQQIISYQNAKRRLTNRYLFGSGVVCGLEVVVPADPPVPGAISVNRGYALDCCGNDIVLSCPYPIDVNKLIRDEGLECGDPCNQAESEDSGQRDYLLCVRYAEVATEPVNAYSPGSTPSCGNTRFSESCTFELCCAPPCEPQRECTFLERLKCLLDDSQSDNNVTYDVTQWNAISKASKLLTAAKTPPVALADDDYKTLKGASDAIKAVTDAIPSVFPAKGWTEQNLITAIEGLRGPARTLARFRYFAPDALDKLTIPAGVAADFATMQAAKDELDKVSPALAQAGGRLRAGALPTFSREALTRANQLADAIENWTSTDSKALEDLRKRTDVLWFIADARKDDKPEPYSFKRYLFVLGRLGREPGFVEIPTDSDWNAGNLAKLKDNADRAELETNSDFESALCTLINPPCCPCDDLCVPLARISVKDCKVMKICNLVRKIIISPAALSYWLPLQQILQQLCCCEPLERDRRGVLNDLIDPFRQAGRKIFSTRPAAESAEPAPVSSETTTNAGGDSAKTKAGTKTAGPKT